VLREDPRAGLPLPLFLFLSLPRPGTLLSSDPPVFQPPALPFPFRRKPPPQLHPRRPPSHRPRFVHRSSFHRVSAPRLSCRTYKPTRHLVTLFSSAPTATGLILRSLSRLRSLTAAPRSLSLLTLHCQQTALNISHDPIFFSLSLSLSLFSSRFLLSTPGSLNPRLTVAYNCDSWHKLY